MTTESAKQAKPNDSVEEKEGESVAERTEPATKQENRATEHAKPAIAQDKPTTEQAEPAKGQAKPQHSINAEHVQRASAQHAKARGWRWLRIVLIVLGVILVLCLIAVAVLGAFVNSGKEELLADNEKGSPRQTIAQDGKSYVLNEDMVTVALIGTDRLYGYVLSDEERGHADAIMLVAYDTSTGKVTLINVPRNTITRFTFAYDDGVENSIETFISASFTYGSTDAKSAETVCGAVSDLIDGIPAENYVVLLESCIDPLTEAMGGVTVTAIQDVPWVGVKEGETYTMTGEQALRYVQWRDTSKSSSPSDRMKRQHDFAQAFLHQSVDAIKKDPSVLKKFYDILTDPQYMTTNLNLNELAYLASAVVMNGVSDLEMLTLPYTEDYDPASHLMGYIPDHKGITDLILKVYYKPAE